MNKKKYNYSKESSPNNVCIELERHPEWNVISITAHTIQYPGFQQETEYVIFYYTYE